MAEVVAQGYWPHTTARTGDPSLVRLASRHHICCSLRTTCRTLALFQFHELRGLLDQGFSFVGFANYTALFSNPTVLTGLSFTLIYALGRAFIVTIIAIPLAVALNKRFVGRSFVRAALFFPAVPSVAILGLVWSFILAPISMGVVNSALGGLFGVGPVPWLSTDLLARLSVIGVGVWWQTGWHAMLYLAYLQSIPGDYYDAADVDGASTLAAVLPRHGPTASASYDDQYRFAGCIRLAGVRVTARADGWWARLRYLYGLTNHHPARHL